jgi:hypothetical protein
MKPSEVDLKDPQNAETVKALREEIERNLDSISSASAVDDYSSIHKFQTELLHLFAHRVASMETTHEGGVLVELARKALKPFGTEYFDMPPEMEHVMYREVERGEDFIIWCPKTGGYETASWRTEEGKPHHWICDECQAHVREGV